MTTEPRRHPLEQARDLLRRQSGQDWVAIAPEVLRRVRRLARPSRELVAFTDAGSPTWDAQGSQLRVTERVLRDAVRAGLAAHGTPMESWTAKVEDHRLASLRVGLCGPWGEELLRSAARARELVVAVLVEALGRDPHFDLALDLVLVVDDVE